jgi:hypothetical protein
MEKLPFGFRVQTASNVDSCPTFRQTLHLPSTWWLCIGCKQVCIFWSLIAYFPQPRAHLLSDSSPLSRFSNQLYHIQRPTYSLPYTRLPKQPTNTDSVKTNTHSPWRRQMQCLPKRWATVNIRRDPYTKVTLNSIRENIRTMDRLNLQLRPRFIS